MRTLELLVLSFKLKDIMIKKDHCWNSDQSEKSLIKKSGKL